MIAWVALAGCSGSKGTSGDSGASSATGDTGGETRYGLSACPPGVAPIEDVVCGDTTAVVAPTGTFPYPSYDLEVSGAVSEVGSALTPVPGASALPGFDSCGPDPLHQVRLIDGDGATWTIGWDVTGTVDDASADAISIGEEVGLHLVLVDESYYQPQPAFVLSDAAGPLVLYEGLRGTLSDADRGQVSVSLDYAQDCRTEDGNWRLAQHLITFAGPLDDVALRSGQTGALTLPDRHLSMTVIDAHTLLECSDGCSSTSWTGWETP